MKISYFYKITVEIIYESESAYFFCKVSPGCELCPSDSVLLAPCGIVERRNTTFSVYPPFKTSRAGEGKVESMPDAVQPAAWRRAHQRRVGKS